MTADAQGFDPAVIVDGHVSWALLSASEQADLLANYPHQAGLNDEQTEKWLDQAYLLRHSISTGFVEDAG